MKHFVQILILLILFSIISACLPINQNTPEENQPVNQAKCPETSNPWDISWLPNEKQDAVTQLDSILIGTGLSGQGNTIINFSVEYQINPAFALAMFKKEASFAIKGSRAYRNNNPGNIRPTGDCKGKASGSACNGLYGEINTDGSFGIYPDMATGIKAYYLLLNSNYRPGTKRNCQDITCIISAYAPSSENDTNTYIKQVTDWATQYQCEILSLNNVIIAAPQIPTQPSTGATITSATIMPEATEYDCSSKSLSLEELANCGIHEYKTTDYVLNIPDCITDGKGGTLINEILFSKNGMSINGFTVTKIGHNTYESQTLGYSRSGDQSNPLDNHMVYTFSQNGYEFHNMVYRPSTGSLVCDFQFNAYLTNIKDATPAP